MMILSLPSHDDWWMLQGDHFCRDCSVMQTAPLFVRGKCLQFVFFPNWISFPAAVSNITTGPVCVSIVCRVRPGSCLRCFVSSGPSWRHDLQQSGPATGESYFTSLINDCQFMRIASYPIFAHIPKNFLFEVWPRCHETDTPLQPAADLPSLSPRQGPWLGNLTWK